MIAAWGINKLRDATPNKTLANSINLKLIKTAPMANNNWKSTNPNESIMKPILMPNLSK